MVVATEQLVAAPIEPRDRGAVGARLTRHAVFIGVLALAIGLRVAVLIAYPYAFWFPDSSQYFGDSALGAPNVLHPFGYSAFLMPFPPDALSAVAIVQHLLGIGLVVAGYVFLLRRGIRPWLAAVAVLPVAIDDLQLTMEHFVTTETLFTVLLAGALLVLTWRRRIPVGMVAIAGVLLAAAVLTRVVALPVIVLVFAYLLVKLLVRQTRWPSLLAFALAVAAPLAGYAVWFHHFHDVYGFDQVGGRALYSRAMSIADCDRLTLTDQQRLLCVPEPPSQRPEAADYWGWNPDSPGNKYFGDMSKDPFLRAFGLTVIKQQPGDYLLLVAKETSWHFLPQAPLSDDTLCRFGGWRLPERPNTACNAAFYTPTPTAGEWPKIVPQPATQLRSVLAGYSHATAAARGPLLALTLLTVLIAVAWRPRCGQRRHSADALLFAATGFGLILASVGFGMYEPRYVVTAVFLLPVAAVLAVHRLFTAKAATEHPPEEP